MGVEQLRAHGRLQREALSRYVIATYIEDFSLLLDSLGSYQSPRCFIAVTPVVQN